MTGVAAASLAGATGSFGTSALLAAQKESAQSTQVRQSGKDVHAGFELGLASYTLRNFKLDQTLAMTRRVGLKYIALKSVHLPLESTKAEIEAVAAKVKEAGLELYGGGVIYMKNETEVNQAFDYAKAAGMKLIIGAPQPELLTLVNKKVQQYDIKLAIHNHGPGDKTYPTPASAYEKIKDLDKRIGLCDDIGHTQRSGVNPSESAERFADRLLDIHIKDVSQATAKGQGVEVGRGVIDIPRYLRTLIKVGYKGVVAFEYEKDADDPLAGLAESVGYVKGVLAATSKEIKN
ncbi:MAG: sugar phosphate isomerase/epimerase [Planctomycetota bacterium]|nr:sugar phosphate isomerase/epimerase [Planctomycetota bacterium]